jgi:DNA topoisomerase II
MQPLGQFGTRQAGGKDYASSRYIFTNLNQMARLIYPEDDMQVMDY